MNRWFGSATYGHYGADNGHNHSRDGGDDGVDDTTDGRNNRTLQERRWVSGLDCKRSRQDLITIIAIDGKEDVRWKRSVVQSSEGLGDVW